MSPRTKRPDGTGCGLCSGDTVTVISGVRLCQPHLDRVQEIAADAGIDATTKVSRAPTAEEVRNMGEATANHQKVARGTPVQCEVCGEVVGSGAGFAAHMRKHSSKSPAVALTTPRREKPQTVALSKPESEAESAAAAHFPITLANIRTCALHVGIDEEQADRLLDLLRFLRKLNQVSA